ncbi:MAG: hypothetical protein ABIP35_12185 [Ginsengibacter sp.]
MKYFYSLMFFLFVSVIAFAQAPMKTTAEYNGQKYPCYIATFNLPPDETEKVVKDKMKSQGYNPEKSKGFLVYRNVKLNELDVNENQDVIFKIERKSRKEKDQTELTMIAAKAGEIPSEKVKGAKIVAEVTTPVNSVTFLNSFQSGINLASYNLELEKITDDVAKGEKAQENLKKEQSKLEKKIKDLQDDLVVNQKDQEKQTAEIARQRKLLEDKKSTPPVN